LIKFLLINWNQLIGSGGFAEVYSGTLKTGASRTLPVAIKVMDIHPDQIQQYGREVSALRMLHKQHHRNIIEFHGWMKVQVDGNQWKTAIITELCKAPLHRAIIEPFFRLIHDRVDVLQQVASGMAFLIRNGLIHRDLKPQNILVRYSLHSEYGDIVLSDFGLAVTMDTIKSMQTKDRIKSSEIGTIAYMAPELGEQGPSEASDIFAYGVTAAYILCLSYPFDTHLPQKLVTVDSLRKFYQKILIGITDPRSISAIETLCLCCDANPDNRPRFITLEQSLSKLILSTYSDYSNSRGNPQSTTEQQQETNVSPFSLKTGATLSLSSLTVDESIELLISLGCTPDLYEKIRTNTEIDKNDINGDYLMGIDDKEYLQLLENNKSKTREPKLKGIIMKLIELQEIGISLTKLEEIRQNILSKQQESLAKDQSSSIASSNEVNYKIFNPISFLYLI
jgi:serine/threonine protein kinase